MKHFKSKRNEERDRKDSWPSKNTEGTVEGPENINPKKGNRTNTENYNSIKFSKNKVIWSYVLKDHTTYLRILTQNDQRMYILVKLLNCKEKGKKELF